MRQKSTLLSSLSANRTQFRILIRYIRQPIDLWVGTILTSSHPLRAVASMAMLCLRAAEIQLPLGWPYLVTSFVNYMPEAYLFTQLYA